VTSTKRSKFGLWTEPIEPFEENSKGSIIPGKLADFVILEKDPRKVQPDSIQDIVIEATYRGGEKVYTAPASAIVLVPQPPPQLW
jgi:hypothetical protein